MMMLTRSVISTCLLFLICVHCATACTDTVYAVGGGDLTMSKDEGDTWSTVLSGRFVFDVKADGENVYAGTKNEIAVSHDGGGSWTFKNLQQNNPSCESNVASIFVDTEKRVYALLGNCGRVAVSSDNGDTWPTNIPFPNTPSFALVQSIYVDGSRIYVATLNGLGYTDDMGASWTFKDGSSGLGSSMVQCVIAKGQTIYVGLVTPNGDVSMSQDGGLTWKTTTATGPTGKVQSMYLRDDTFYVATFGGGLSWSNDFTTWTTKTTADGLANNITWMTAGAGDNLYLGTIGGLSISRNNGQTWITKTTADGMPSDWITAVIAQCV